MLKQIRFRFVAGLCEYSVLAPSQTFKQKNTYFARNRSVEYSLNVYNSEAQFQASEQNDFKI